VITLVEALLAQCFSKYIIYISYEAYLGTKYYHQFIEFFDDNCIITNSNTFVIKPSDTEHIKI